MALRQIRFFDDEILRKKSRKVEVVDEKIMLTGTGDLAKEKPKPDSFSYM